MHAGAPFSRSFADLARRPWLAPLIATYVACLCVCTIWAWSSAGAVVGDPPAASTVSAPEAMTTTLGPTTLQVTSTPQGAQIFVDGVYMGKTPARSVTLRGARAVRVELRKDGFESATYSVTRTGGETLGVQSTLVPQQQGG